MGETKQRHSLTDEERRKRRIAHQRALREKKKQKKRKARILITAGVVIVAVAGGFGVYSVSIQGAEKKASVIPYEAKTYADSVYKESGLYATDLCVAEKDQDKISYSGGTDVHAAGLFDLTGKEVLYSNKIHERLYPASTTKIMTALLALEKGNLSDTVTVSKHAAAASFESDAQVCGLKEGDEISLEDLLYGLLLYSGNDAATAIAEHISGSEEAFVQEMNSRAKELMATETHFVNPHGLHDDDHYTTAYDLYLIFNECIKNKEFLKIIESDGRDVSIKEADGTTRTDRWEPTNYYAKGLADAPEGVTVVGGKTGTTGEAGFCLILFEKDRKENPYISIVMGAGTKDALYQDMTALMKGTNGASS